MKPIVLAFVNAAYIPVGRNWLTKILALNLPAEVRIVALDADSRDAFSDAEVLYRPLADARLDQLWVHRMQVFLELLEAGQDFVHSDADAVWLRDPLPVITDCDADLVFSQGTVWPPDIHAKHGLVLCCGLFFVRANPVTTAFFVEAARRVLADKDDQTTINRLVDERIAGWQVEEGDWIDFRDTRFLISHKPIRSIPPPGQQIPGPTVAVLPHALVPRMVTEIGPPVLVAHPLSGKTCADKQRVLGSLGLWPEWNKR